MPLSDQRRQKTNDTNNKRLKRTDSEKELKELHHLLEVLTLPASTQQLPTVNHDDGKQGQRSNSRPRSGSNPEKSQAVALHKFSLRYQNVRSFNQSKHVQLFEDIFSSLVTARLCQSKWLSSSSDETVVRLLVCLRILMRDCHFQTLFFKLGGVQSLSEYFEEVTEVYLTENVGQYMIDILKEITNIFQKLSVIIEQRVVLIHHNVHVALVRLLSANDVLVLHCSLHALNGLAQSENPRSLIGELNCVEYLLRIIQDYDTVSKKLAAQLLRLLCGDQGCSERVRDYDGIPVLLSQLHSENVNLLWQVVWCIVQLCEDSISSTEIRQLGGIPLLLSLLHERKLLNDKNENNNPAVASAGIHGRTPITPDEIEEVQYSLKSACCAALTELVLNDTNAQQIAQANGIFSLGLLILPQDVPKKDQKAFTKLQRNAFRTLRFLFSMERNRCLFKRLFPVKLFECFINVGHYNKDLSAYKPLVDLINSLPKSKVDEIQENIQDTNQNRNPSKYIGDYSVFELLGTGAFGSVYRVKKTTSGQSFLALKEVNVQNTAFGKNSLEIESSLGDITNELQIMKEELKHPNIVRYYKTFLQGDKLYIVMDLIEGAPLSEHVNSLKEKQERFSEKRIWDIFLQMVLALRYLHQEKNIVHRDLTPGNVMLGENDKITITDFGLAKQKRNDCSKMTSVVGTILYSCPEIVQHKPYGEKADIWAFGCILYQLCTLQPPFYSSNMLSLVTKIVEADYVPISKGDYSQRLIDTVNSLIIVKPEDRPDILQVSAKVVDLILIQTDNLRSNQAGLEKKLNRERKRTQKSYIEANQKMEKYHRLYLDAEERLDRLIDRCRNDRQLELKGFEEMEVYRRYPSSTEGDDGCERVWTSDDESNPSSGSESRESSAGSTRSRTKQISKHPPFNKDLRHRTRNRPDPFSPLQLNIPVYAKSSRDSGLSSGDPSPNMNTSTTSSPNTPNQPGYTEDVLASPDVASLINYRPHLLRSQSSTDTNNLSQLSRLQDRSRAATLSISNSRLREITDPIVQMLVQLHKIIYITQLPPTLSPNFERRKIDEYKRALFSRHSNAVSLKAELKKLMQGCHDIVDILTNPADILRRPPSSGLDRDPSGLCCSDREIKEMGITYEQLHNLIEKTLNSTGYYSVAYRQREKTPPFSPIAKHNSRLS